MVTKRLLMRSFVALSILAWFGTAAHAQLRPVTVDEAFKVQPRQPGVNVSTPTPDQVPNCKVEPIPNPNDAKNPMGYVVRDPAGKPVRQFVSYDGKSYNIVAFYVNGEEAYREVYPPQTGEAYQFRWLGPNGTKWGLDRDRDGRIDDWVAISPEELSQELLAAVLAKDAKRAEALVVTKANLDALGLKGAESQKRLDRTAGAAKRVLEAADALKLGAETRWLQFQLGIPQATPADALQSQHDLITHKTGTILLQDGKESKFLQTGELMQIGRAWKLVDGPLVEGAGGVAGAAFPKEIEGLIKQVNDLDANAPKEPTRENVSEHNAKRAAILEQIVAKIEPKDQETWARLLADSLAAAAEVEKPDGKHITRLKELKDALAKGPNQNLAAYVAFRYLVTENSLKLLGSSQVEQIQDEWRGNLEAFAKRFPDSEEAPEALLRLGLACEYMKDHKEGEARAKATYQQIVDRYSKHPHAAKAQGAIRRLECEGKPFELAGANLDRNNEPFDIASLKGKVIVVYYCASWSTTLSQDARQLRDLAKEYGSKGVELVTVCLDNDAKAAVQTVSGAGLPGTHLHSPGGLDASPLAAKYGILVVPHLFVIDKDGKVANRNGHPATVEEDLKRLIK
ncbi:MAG TPA: redoxin family protein [Gemmata sp.]|nr:redoxin family protein [Gemmata sp.]